MTTPSDKVPIYISREARDALVDKSASPHCFGAAMSANAITYSILPSEHIYNEQGERVVYFRLTTVLNGESQWIVAPVSVKASILIPEFFWRWLVCICDSLAADFTGWLRNRGKL